MKKLSAFILSGMVFATPVQAQFMTPLMLKGRTVAPAGFAGPGDVNTFASWYGGSYAYSAATRGTNAVEVCHSNGVNCVNVASDATTGIVPNPSPLGTACNTSTNICTVRTFYDQAGGGRNMVQTTVANQAIWKPAGSCTGFGAGISCAFSNTSTQYQIASWTLAQPYSLAWAVRRDASTATNTDVFASNGNEFGAGFFGSNNDAVCYAGSGGLNPAATDATPHAVSCSVNSPSSSIKIDSAAPTTGDPGTGTFAGGFSLLWSVGNGGRNWLGYFVGGGVAASNFTTTDLANQNANAHTNGGF